MEALWPILKYLVLLAAWATFVALARVTQEASNRWLYPRLFAILDVFFFLLAASTMEVMLIWGIVDISISGFWSFLPISFGAVGLLAGTLLAILFALEGICAFIPDTRASG